MYSSRMKSLLRSTARDLKQGITPLNGDFLASNDVTIDEAFDLADAIALGVNVLLHLAESGDSGSRILGLVIGEVAIAESLEE